MSELATTTPSARFEEPPCPLCGSGDRKPVLRADDWFFGLGRDFQVVRCGACAFHYTCPRPTPEAIGSFYPEHYWEGPEEGSDWAGFTRGMKQLLGSRTGKVLDVGCGEGAFLAEAMRFGWEATGIEPGRAAVELGRAAGRKIQHGTLEDLQAAPGSYDMVTLLDVLEHLHDPVDTLRRCAGLLAPDGYLAVRLPNFGSWERRLFGRHWAGLQLPTHLQHFTPRDLRRAARQAGLETVHEEGVAVSFFVPSLHQALRAWRGNPVPSPGKAFLRRAQGPVQGARAGAASGEPEAPAVASPGGALNWKGRLLWSGVRAAERLSAAVLPRLHQRFLVGPISCSFLARPGTTWPPR